MAASADKKQPGRGAGRRFEKGASGNPNGRRPGIRNRVTMVAEKILEDGAKAVADAVIAAATGGDMTAARLVLDRIYPTRRGRPIAFSLPSIESAEDIIKAIGSIAASMARGDLSPEEAAAVASVIELKRRAIETDAHERRLAALEEKSEDDK